MTAALPLNGRIQIKAAALLREDSAALEASFQPLLNLSLQRRLSPPAEDAALAILEAQLRVKALLMRIEPYDD